MGREQVRKEHETLHEPGAAPLRRSRLSGVAAAQQRRLTHVWFLAILSLCFAEFCTDAMGAGPFSPSRTNQITLTKPPIHEIGAGLFQIGEVRLDKNTKSVSFAGSVNMTNGVVEYAVVGRRGKLHESVLVTQAEPYHIHLAMLLLGATNQTAKAESGRLLTGHPVQIWVSWKDGEKEKRAKLEELLCKERQSQPLTPGIWIYNGSRVVDGTFLAQRDESIIAIIDDPDALVNNPRKGRENDESWFVSEKAVPSAGADVRLTVELMKSED